MSRSTRKAIYKDKGHRKNDYWKVHRRVNKQIGKHYFKVNPDDYLQPYRWGQLESPQYKSPRKLINDYDYCDYIIDEEYNYSTFTFGLSVKRREDRKETLIKMRRK